MKTTILSFAMAALLSGVSLAGLNDTPAALRAFLGDPVAKETHGDRVTLTYAPDAEAIETSATFDGDACVAVSYTKAGGMTPKEIRDLIAESTDADPAGWTRENIDHEGDDRVYRHTDGITVLYWSPRPGRDTGELTVFFSVDTKNNQR